MNDSSSLFMAMVSKMMAARIHPALSQSLGGVGVVVSV